MRTKSSNLILGVGVIAAIALACNFSATTANISGLKLGKDERVSQETNSFEPDDSIYAVAVISNAPGKLKVRGRLLVESVTGQEAGPIPGLEDTVDLEGSGTATFTFSPPSKGWPKGSYKIEVIMINESGQQKDQEATSFTVS